MISEIGTILLSIAASLSFATILLSFLKSDLEYHVGGAISNTGTQPDPVEKALPWA